MTLLPVLFLSPGFIRHPPVFVRAVPVDGRGQTFLEIGVLWHPAELGLKFGGVDGIALIATGAVVHMVEVVGVAAHELQNHAQHINVVVFAIGSHEVGFPDAASGENRPDGTAVIFHADPVAHSQTLPVEFRANAGKNVRDLAGNELLHVLIGAVVIAAIADGGFESVRAVPGAHQVVAGGLGRRIRAGRFVRAELGEFALFVQSQIAIHFVGADVVESNIVAAGGLEQHVRAGHVRVEEWGGVENRIIVMRFGGEVHNGVNRGYCGCRALVQPRKQGFHKLGIANIAMHKGQVRGRHAIEILAFAGIRERIQNSHVGLRMVARHPVHEVRADEPCATGD